MARILFAAELVTRPSDLLALRAMAIGARASGHHVIVALRDAESGRRLFARTGIHWVAAPIAQRRVPNPVRAPNGFAGLLHNAGFALAPRLLSRCRSWRTLFGLVRPQVLVAFRSPTALLAVRGLPIKTVLADGSGALAPPGTKPLPALRPWANPDAEKMAAAEAAVLARCNQVLKVFKAPEMESLGDLFATSATALATFWPLDPFGRRAIGYLGWRIPRIKPKDDAKPVEWPEGKGAKVLVVLRPFQAIEPVLDGLRDSGQRALIVVPRLKPEIAEKHAAPNLAFASGKFDVVGALAACDAALVHGDHAALATLLLDGKPVVILPSNAEQRLLARRVVEVGAGRLLESTEAAAVAEAVRALGEDKSLAAGAKSFSDKHGAFKLDDTIKGFAALLAKLVPPAPAKPKQGAGQPAAGKPAAPVATKQKQVARKR